MTTSTSTPRIRPTVTGGLQAPLSESGFVLMWEPGFTRLYLAGLSTLVSVEPDKYRVWEGTARAARQAMLLFIADGTEVQS